MCIILQKIICNFSKIKIKVEMFKIPEISGGNLISGLFPGTSERGFPVVLFQFRMYVDTLD